MFHYPQKNNIYVFSFNNNCSNLIKNFNLLLQSAISLIGNPMDLYVYGPMNLLFYLGMALSYVIGLFTIIPLMYPLKLASIYEYFILRYESRAVRLLSALIGMMQNFCYLIIALLAPGLAVQVKYLIILLI